MGRFYFFAINCFVGAMVRTNSRACERDASEKAASARIGKDFSAQGQVGGSFRVATLGASSSGRIRAKFNLAGKNGTSAARVHDQQVEIVCLATELKANAGTF